MGKQGYDVDFAKVRLVLPTDPGEIGYLAGLLDGEGTLTVRRNGAGGKWKTHEVVIFNNDFRLMDWLAGMGGTIYRRENRATSLGRATQFAWQVRRQADVIVLLETLLPYLKIKRAKAISLLDSLKPHFLEVVGG
jgi:hypothetical protein